MLIAAVDARPRLRPRSSAAASGWLLREPILSLYLPQHRRGMFGYLHTAIGDSAVWKDLLWLLILLPVFGLAAFILAVVFWTTRWRMISLPIWYWSIPGGVDLGLHQRRHARRGVDGHPARARAVRDHRPAHARARARAWARSGRGLLAPSERRRVAGARAHARGRRRRPGRRAAADRARPPRRRPGAARRARDGPRHGAGEARPATPRRAQELITGAHSEAKKAIAELRDLCARHLPRDPHRPRARARAVLDRRAATRSRWRSTSSSTAACRPPPRRPPTSSPSRRSPTSPSTPAPSTRACAIEHRGDRLRVEVSDDGDGGADADGAGLTGLRQRVEALDGRLAVQSGELGTTIRAELPCAS